MGGQTSRSYSTQRTAKNRTCRQKNREERQQRQGKAGSIAGWQGNSEEQGRGKQGGAGRGKGVGQRRLLPSLCVNLACPMAVLELLVPFARTASSNVTCLLAEPSSSQAVFLFLRTLQASPAVPSKEPEQER